MRNDKKVKAIRGKFGNLEGYAIYNMVLESIAEEELLRVGWDEVGVDIMAGDFGVDSEFLSQIVEYSVQIGLFQLQDGYLVCRQLEQRHKDVFEKRGRNLSDLRVSVTETRVPAPEGTHSIVENRIAKHSTDRGSEDSWYQRFKKAYPLNGSCVDPNVEKWLIKNESEDLEAIIETASDYDAYCRVKYADTYPHGDMVKYAINWLTEKRWAVNWKAKTPKAKKEITAEDLPDVE